MKLISQLLFKEVPSNTENELRLLQTKRLKDPLASFELGPNRISISGSAHLLRGMNNNYPIQDLAYPEINCRSLPIEDGSVDLYPSDQVLEHVGLNPQAVFDEAYRVLKLNGVAIVTTCLINPLHMEPTDYLRFTPYALHEMSEKAGFRDLESFTVGNEFDFLLQRLGGAGRKYRVVTRMVRDFASRYSRKKSPIFTGIILEE